jgi:hypothetical protein
VRSGGRIVSRSIKVIASAVALFLGVAIIAAAFVPRKIIRHFGYGEVSSTSAWGELTLRFVYEGPDSATASTEIDVWISGGDSSCEVRALSVLLDSKGEKPQRIELKGSSSNDGYFYSDALARPYADHRVTLYPTLAPGCANPKPTTLVVPVDYQEEWVSTLQWFFRQ